jgi:DNA-binding NtrC family response regulator
MPALREVDGDIIELGRHFIEKFNLPLKKNIRGFTQAAEKKILQYNWPGNVRELANCLERAMIFAETPYIDAHDLILQTPASKTAEAGWQLPDGGLRLEDMEKQLLEAALQRARGNKSQAARLLGLSRDTFRYRLEKYQLG